jgi:hypothetical protein
LAPLADSKYIQVGAFWPLEGKVRDLKQAHAAHTTDFLRFYHYKHS